MSALIVWVTCPRDHAATLANLLVSEQHAACVNIVPQIQSVYRWQGQVQSDEEALLLIKTDITHFDALKAAVLQHHPYELPEVIAVKIEAAHIPYLDWITLNLR